jgi:uncharacterized metal-binding protein YceD (DUF177 family)
MPLLLNIESLANGPVRLTGELSERELDMQTLDELIEVNKPLNYDVTVEQTGENILLQGSIHMLLQCECVRCLESFTHHVNLPNWSCLLPLAGEEKIELSGVSLDLTPYLREDTFLAFPQHPLCKTGCDGTPKQTSRGGYSTKIRKASDENVETSIWSELDNLNLE